jgi:hypothetical protein
MKFCFGIKILVLYRLSALQNILLTPFDGCLGCMDCIYRYIIFMALMGRVLRNFPVIFDARE